MPTKLSDLFQVLDMSWDNGLAETGNKNMAPFQDYFFKQAKEKLKVDAVFFLRDAEGVPKVPLVYFKSIDTYDVRVIAELHRLAWNSSDAPILFVVTPDQYIIYNNYNYEKLDFYDEDSRYTNGLLDTVYRLVDLEDQKQQLRLYNRMSLETGEIWQTMRDRFNIKNRADNTLIANLKIVRSRLITNIKNRISSIDEQKFNLSAVVHSLLGRSIMVKYLEERKGSDNRSVFPDGYFEGFLNGAKQYTDVLESKDATYSLFEKLSRKFNGDIFPITEEEKTIIQESDLKELRKFFTADEDLSNRQLALWKLYSFNVIPIQLISSMYELFFHLSNTDTDKQKGTYYTPLHLVNMLMDEVLPWDGDYESKTIIDPACGSGIFLVESFRRMVIKWIYSHPDRHITPEILTSILQRSIFGVDSNEEAVRIASFSLCLTLCDFLDPKTIWNELRFPTLFGHNLIHSDFLAEDGRIAARSYDIVIGNPPWESRLSDDARNYIDNRGYPIADNRIEQVFTWKAAEICGDNGIVCLLMPCKSFLFNKSNTAREYRKEFFNKNKVSVIINFSAFSKGLFEHASWAACAVVYSVGGGNINNEILYCTPKPAFTIEDNRAFIIESSDICKVVSGMLSDELIWKVAMVGTPRDLEIIHKLQYGKPRLDAFLNMNDMICAEGYKRGNGRMEYRNFRTLPYITPKDFKPGYNTPKKLPEVDFVNFERIALKHLSIYESPHLIFKQSPKNKRFLVDVLDFKAVFNHSFIGIHGNVLILKYLAIIMSSKLFFYYHLLTSGRLMIERGELEKSETDATPIPNPTKKILAESSELFDKIINKNGEMSVVDDFVNRLYGVYDYEIQLIEEAIEITYDYYSQRSNSKAVRRLEKIELQQYGDILKKTLLNTIGNQANLSISVLAEDAPLNIVCLDFDDGGNNDYLIPNVEAALNALDKILIEERSQGVFVRRNVRLYRDKKIYIIKPNQYRYWSISSAFKDADEICFDILHGSR